MVGIISLRFREFLWTWCRFKQINITLPKALPKQTKTYPKKICFFLKKKTGDSFFWSLPSKRPSDQRNQVAEAQASQGCQGLKISELSSELACCVCKDARRWFRGFALEMMHVFFRGGNTFFWGGLVKAGYKKRPHLGSMDLSESCKLHRCFSEPLHRCFFVLAQP